MTAMQETIYLDYAATTPVHPGVRQAMMAALEAGFGNPSSMHWAGRAAAALLGQARQDTAAAIGCSADEIHFTSGATESDNLALLGVLRRKGAPAHLITTSIEHHANLHAAARLGQEGFSVTLLPVDGNGRVNPQDVQAAIRPETALISVMLVNNETGTIQPVAEIGALARRHGIPMHTDAVQGLGLLPVTVDDLNVDLLSLSAHKIYGPKGVGALYVRQGLALQPLGYGGGQEAGLRPGTENMPGILGLAAALNWTCQHRGEARRHISTLRERLVEQLEERIPGVQFNSPPDGAAHIVSVSFPNADGEMMLLLLNRAGVAVSLGSACTSKSIEPSHVLLAMGLSRSQIDGSLRISIGHPTRQDEIDTFIELVTNVYQRCILE